MFLFDTNAIIAVLTERVPSVARRLEVEASLGTPLLLSTIVLHELRYGIAKSARRAHNQALFDQFLELPIEIAEFGPEDAEHAGDIRAYLAVQGRPIGPYDVLIAAQARCRKAVLVSANRQEFERVPGLIVTDWGSA